MCYYAPQKYFNVFQHLQNCCLCGLFSEFSKIYVLSHIIFLFFFSFYKHIEYLYLHRVKYNSKQETGSLLIHVVSQGTGCCVGQLMALKKDCIIYLT